jgi:hypothetical protein
VIRRVVLVTAAVLAGSALAGSGLGGCEPSAAPPGQSDASASPNASILPAPLATEPPDLVDGGADDGGRAPSGIAADASGRLLVPDAGAAPPESLRPSTPIAAEQVPFLQDAPGVTLDAVFRWRDVPAPPRAPEVSGDGLREAQKLTALTLKIDLTAGGRMRAELTGRAFPLPAHTELRARTDHYGNLVLWPNATEYRVIPPGALRIVLGERRVDVTPLSTGTVRPQGEGKRLGVTVRKLELASTIATVKLELGKVPESGEGGMLLCRALVELGGVDPKSPACQPGEVPLAASYAWQEGGGISFEVGALAKRTDLPAASLLVPPPGVRHAPSGLPATPQGIFLSREELAAFRTAPLPLPPVRDPAVPGEGFVAVNQSDRPMYLLLDGVATVAVPAHAERYIIGPPRGRYQAQWRSFLGEKVVAPQAIEMPARIVYGAAADAGTPDGG